MKQLTPILITSVLTALIVVLLYPKPKQEQTDHREQFKQEINDLKQEIEETILKDLRKQYENIDTITSTVGVIRHVNDFKERAGYRLPNR
tara:strand:+ start:1418 stop:1687 length:270 start_codon:yes stop_codon:yes gene_type:complete